MRSGQSGVARDRSHQPRNRVSRRRSRAPGKENSRGARAGWGIERRGRGADRHAAADESETCRSIALMEIAAGLGADVPFFLFGGRALAVNRGDEIYPLPDAPKRTIVVVSPKGIGVSTKDAYEWVSAELTNRAKPPNIWRFCALCWSRQGTRRQRFRRPRFQPPSATRRNPGRIAQARSRRSRAGG